MKRDLLPNDVKYLVKFYDKRTLQQLLDHLNFNRNKERQLHMSMMRRSIKSLGLSHFKFIRWTNEQSLYLLNNYRFKSNKELGEILSNQEGSIRNFTGGHVRKKMELLNLHRTSEEWLFITLRNHELYENSCFKPGHKPVNNIKTLDKLIEDRDKAQRQLSIVNRAYDDLSFEDKSSERGTALSNKQIELERKYHKYNILTLKRQKNEKRS